MAIGEEDARSRWYFRRKRSARIMKLRRAALPIAPPTMAPVLLGLDDADNDVDADVDGWEAVVEPVVEA